MRAFRFLTVALASALAAAIVALTGGEARAAYQVLALVATAEPVPLSCQRGECVAEFTAFCLQPTRASPPRGAPYTVYRGEGVTLVGAAADGRRLRIPAAGLVTIAAIRGHTAVRISLSEKRLRALGLRQAAIEVAERVSLIPKPIRGDRNPQTEADIAIATGPLRALGARIVDHGGARTVAARLTNDMINSLPEMWQVESEVYKTLWDRVAPRWTARAASAEAVGLARKAFESCAEMRGQGLAMTMRQCLGAQHDMLIGERNNAYWKALRTGS